jgi:hypothetical protein
MGKIDICPFRHNTPPYDTIYPTRTCDAYDSFRHSSTPSTSQK